MHCRAWASVVRVDRPSPAQMARLAELDERELQILRSYDVEAMDQLGYTGG